MKYDLLLWGGEVIDPGEGIRGRRDVALSAGKVALVAENISKEQARECVDVSGKLVVPGLIDIHGHFFHKFLPWAVEPDQVCLSNGVTTAVDAGSMGLASFAGFRDFIAKQSRTRLYCFLNISSIGFIADPHVPEVANMALADVKKTVECINQNRDTILGGKVRIAYVATGIKNALPALEAALQAAKESQTRMMVHISGSPLPLIDILSRLRPGDIICHIFAGGENNILDWNHRVRPEVKAAVRRGVILDGACAWANLNFNVARAVLEDGLLPHTLSSDICVPSYFGWPVTYDLLEVMSIFLALGLSLEEVLRCNTTNAALAIGKSSEIGSLRTGTAGDVSVLQFQEGNFTFIDWEGNELKTKQKLVPALTVHNGKIWEGT